MPSLSDFLVARIGEDEAVAREALDAPESEWWVDPRQQVTVRGAPSTRVAIAVTIGWKTAAHVTRHDPARVLAECEAKRAIVEWAADVDADYAGAAGPTETLLPLLALPYADHEDYQADWRP